MDQQEFANRTEAIKTRLYRTAYLYLGSEADALEAVDETVYRALRKLKQLQTPAFFETWITRILINTCQDELRRRRRFHPGGADALPDTAGPDDYEHLPLREAIRRLPEELRSVVILRFFSGYTQAETAAALVRTFDAASGYAVREGATLLVLDEVCAAVNGGFLPEKTVTDFLENRPDMLEVVLTGRSPSAGLTAHADYITEMQKRRHPYEKGVAAREGIEF